MTRRLGMETGIVDAGVLENSVRRFRDAGIVMPTLTQLASPDMIPADVAARLSVIDPDAADPLNLFRVHWYNRDDRRAVGRLPPYVELPSALTGVDARIVVVLGNRFPMIRAHKVLAAYGCLAPRLVTGQFDPTHHRAIWPSTGNYCRGGVAISRIMGCRGVAVLPENMSRERFRWLEDWVEAPEDIIRTPGSESNVKEIYDACKELIKDESNIVFNQFCEFGNYVVHRLCTGHALGAVFAHLQEQASDLRLFAFVAATGSAGTLAAGDALKQRFGSKIIAMEALECPTLLENGFGEHNIQGIGDKHLPLIHNVMNTDVVAAVSDQATDRLDSLFNTDVGRAYLAERKGIPAAVVDALPDIGYSGICNLLGAIKTAKHFDLGPADVILTVATDGAELYAEERPGLIRKHYGNRFDTVAAAETWGQHLAGQGTEHLLELTQVDKRRIFNLGYFTWVEQQGISVEEFTLRRRQRFWDGLMDLVPAWDGLITDFNARTGVTVP